MEKIRLGLQMVMNELNMREVVQTGDVIDMLKDIMKMVEELDYKNREEVKGNVYKLREEYFVMAWKKPFTWWSESVLEQKVAELKDKNTVKGDALDTKKSEWKV